MDIYILTGVTVSPEIQLRNCCWSILLHPAQNFIPDKAHRFIRLFWKTAMWKWTQFCWIEKCVLFLFYYWWSTFLLLLVKSPEQIRKTYVKRPLTKRQNTRFQESMALLFNLNGILLRPMFCWRKCIGSRFCGKSSSKNLPHGDLSLW